MASIAKRPDGRYRARIRVNGREVARHFKLRRDAEAWLQEQAVKVRRGEWVDPRSGRTTVEEYGREWAATRAWRPGSRETIERALARRVYPYLGPRPLGKLRASDIQGWLQGPLVDLGLSEGSRKWTMDVLGMMLRSAVRDRIIARSPLDDVPDPARPKRPPRQPVVPLTVEQVRALIEATPERWRAYVALGAGCGLRASEALGLGVEQVDFLRGRVRVVRQLATPGKGGTWRLGLPKTRASNREVPLPRHTAELLARHLQRWPEQDVGFARLIFVSSRGRPVRADNASRVVAQAARRAGLPEGTRYHDLRHHYASLLIAQGLTVKAVQSALGHATAAETLDTYGHLWPAEADAIAGAVEQAWSATEPHALRRVGL